jgi:hypothetical protein
LRVSDAACGEVGRFAVRQRWESLVVW